MATVIQRSALLFHSARQMFDLVNDVAKYPQFVDHCVASEVLEQGPEHLRARLSLEKAGVDFTFTTDNRLTVGETPMSEWAMDMTLLDGPFSSFSGCWKFLPLREGACKVSLHIEFVMNNALASKVAANLFESMGGSLVDAFCKRADVVYAKSAPG